MKVRFLPTAGIGGVPGLVEVEEGQNPGERTPVYEKPWDNIYLTLSCRDLKKTDVFYVSRPRTSEQIKIDNFGDPVQRSRSLVGTGVIQLNGSSSVEGISEFGDSEVHREMEVRIKDNGDAEQLYLNDHNFEIHMKSDRFSELLQEFLIPNSELIISLDISQFADFFMTPSHPSFVNGPVVKLMWNKRDVENLQDIPDGFLFTSPEEEWARRDQFGEPTHRPRVSISVITSLLPSLSQTLPSDTEPEWRRDAQGLEGLAELFSAVVMSKIEGEMAMVLKRINYQNILLTIFFIFIVVISFVLALALPK
jgi:hypothetical protein